MKRPRRSRARCPPRGRGQWLWDGPAPLTMRNARSALRCSAPAPSPSITSPALPRRAARTCASSPAARARRREALAERFGVPEATDDSARALERSDVDAVIVATPDDTHEAIAVAAARAGKAILLQKPMAGSVAAAERIVAAATRCGVDLQVSFMHRFFEEVDRGVALARRTADRPRARPRASATRRPGPTGASGSSARPASPTASSTSSACTASISSSTCWVACAA